VAVKLAPYTYGALNDALPTVTVKLHDVSEDEGVADGVIQVNWVFDDTVTD
jgi:hypothetical protein